MIFLNINNLNVSIEGKKILDDFNLTINQGEVHAIMGPNGSGKSTLANVLAGNEDYEVNSGKIIFKDQDLLALNTYLKKYHHFYHIDLLQLKFIDHL